MCLMKIHSTQHSKCQTKKDQGPRAGHRCTIFLQLQSGIRCHQHHLQTGVHYLSWRLFNKWDDRMNGNFPVIWKHLNFLIRKSLFFPFFFCFSCRMFKCLSSVCRSSVTIWIFVPIIIRNSDFSIKPGPRFTPDLHLTTSDSVVPDKKKLYLRLGNYRPYLDYAKPDVQILVNHSCKNRTNF